MSEEMEQSYPNKMADLAAQLQTQYGTHIEALNRQLKEQRATTLRMEQLCQEQAQHAEAMLQNQQAQHMDKMAQVHQQVVDRQSAVHQEAQDMTATIQYQAMAHIQMEANDKQRLMREVEILETTWLRQRRLSPGTPRPRLSQSKPPCK